MTEDLNPANWGSDAAETEPVPGEDEDFPNLGSVPEPPEDTISLEEIQQVEQSLLADSANAQYTTGTAQRVDDESTIEPMPDPPEVVEEELIEEVIVEEEVEVDGEVTEDVILEEDVEVEIDGGAALDIDEAEDVAVADIVDSQAIANVLSGQLDEADQRHVDVYFSS